MDFQYEVRGFFTCTQCGKLHTYSPGFSVVECACGARIDQYDREAGA